MTLCAASWPRLFSQAILEKPPHPDPLRASGGREQKRRSGRETSVVVPKLVRFRTLCWYELRMRVVFHASHERRQDKRRATAAPQCHNRRTPTLVSTPLAFALWNEVCAAGADRTVHCRFRLPETPPDHRSRRGSAFRECTQRHPRPLVTGA